MTTVPSPNTSCSLAVISVVRLFFSAEYVSGRVPPGGSAENILSCSSFGHEPLRAGEQVRVGRVVPVVMRQREVRDVGRLVARGRELRRQRRRELHEALLIVAAHQALLVAEPAAALVIGDGAGVPHQHAARMDDEIRRDRQRHFLDVGIGEPIARRVGREHAAVEDVEARGSDGAALRV